MVPARWPSFIQVSCRTLELEVLVAQEQSSSSPKNEAHPQVIVLTTPLVDPPADAGNKLGFVFMPAMWLDSEQ
jgi:hypothetical protein